MPTRNVVLTDHQSCLVDTLVESGRYQNASEVLREGLRLVEEKDAEAAAKLAALKAAVRVGIEQLDRGEYTEFADPKALGAHLDTISDTVLKRKRAR